MDILGSLFQRDRDLIGKADQHFQRGELERAAELYIKAKSYDQAADAFAKLGDLDRAIGILRDSGHTLRAAELADGHGELKGPNGAIVLFEEAGGYRQAGEACVRVQLFQRAGRNYEKAGMFRKAAECFSQAGEMDRALAAWRKEISDLEQQRQEKPGVVREIRELELLSSEILESLGRFADAGRLLRRHGMAARAAPLFERSEQFAEAAEAYLAINRPEEALGAIEQAANADPALRAEVYRRCAKHEEAGRLFGQLGRHEEAAEAFEQVGAWAQAAAEWESAETPARAAGLYARVGRHRNAACCFALADQHEAAAQSFLKAGEPESAAGAFEAAKKPLAAAEAYLQAGLAEAAIKTLQSIEPHRVDYARASAMLIPLLLDQGLIEGARHRFEALSESGRHDKLQPAEVLYLEGRFEEAEGHFSKAEVCYQKVVAEQHDFRDANDRLRDAREKLSMSGAMPAIGLAPGSGPVPIVDPRSTAPVPIPGVARAGSPLSGPAELVESGARPLVRAPLAGPSLEGLPFEIEQPLEPWWIDTTLYRAADRRDDTSVLLVTFPESFVQSQDLRFTMGKVVAFRDAGVLGLREVVLAHGNVLLLYEDFAGEPLGLVLARGRQPPTFGLNILVQLCNVLATALKLNITHQWLSPRTVLVDDDVRIRLAGIGLGQVLASHDHTSRAYLGPEVRRGVESSTASDVYSLGLLAMELLRAQMPVSWQAGDDLDFDKVGWSDEVREMLSSHLRSLLVRCLRSDPLERPSVEELKTALTSVGLVPGQILVDRYEIQGELGRGGMSRVYRARDRQFDDEVAIKTVLAPVSGPSEDQDRLFREVQICRKISHPNVVRVHDFGSFPGGIFIIMELLDGPGLDRVIRERAPLSLTEVRSILGEITSALGEAHRLKAIHRDLKPANVILVEGRAKVMDFGIALINDGSSTQLTRAGEVMGSPMYMAPEQIQGQALTGACDFYALGVIAYAMLSGREPFQAETATAVVLKHLHEPPPDIRQWRPELPDDWVVLLDRMLAKKPDDRFQTAADLSTAVGRLPV